ncbi:hypothetical protein ACIXJZ_12750 [Bacteroides fragilis]
MIFLAGDLLGDRMIRDIPDGISSDLIYTARIQITVPVYRTFRTQQSGDVFASFSRHNDFAFIHHLMERGTSETADYSSDGGKFSQQVVICLNKAKTTNFTLLGVKSGAYFFIYRQSVFIAVRSAT